MPKPCRITAILLLLPLIVIGCSYGPITNSTPTPITSKHNPIPAPTPTFIPIAYTPIVFTPTPAPAPTCDVLGIFDCEYPSPTPCQPNYVYNDLVNEGQSWQVVDPQQVQNNSASPIQVTFTSKTSRTITVTDQQGLTLSLSSNTSVPLIGVITASVQKNINHEVSRSVTTSFSIS